MNDGNLNQNHHRIFSWRDNWERVEPLLTDLEIREAGGLGFGLEGRDWNGVTEGYVTILSPEKLRSVVEPLIYERFSYSDFERVRKNRSTERQAHDNLGLLLALSADDEDSIKNQVCTYLFKHRLNQVFASCFVRSLVEMGIPDADEIGLLESESYAVVYFIKDRTMHFVDMLIDWQSTDELEEFLGEITNIRRIKHPCTNLNLRKDCTVTFE